MTKCSQVTFSMTSLWVVGFSNLNLKLNISRNSEVRCESVFLLSLLLKLQNLHRSLAEIHSVKMVTRPYASRRRQDRFNTPSPTISPVTMSTSPSPISPTSPSSSHSHGMDSLSRSSSASSILFLEGDVEVVMEDGLLHASKTLQARCEPIATSTSF